MQFYLNGYQPGDPTIEAPHPSVSEREEGVPREVDVLIVGCGPAGLVLAAQMSRFPDIRTAIIDRRDGPLEVGQADAVSCRTIEMFEAFGLAHRLLTEGYWANEIAFWGPDPEDPSRIKRAARTPGPATGLSEFPSLLVNQARMHAYLLEYMERSASRLTPFYGLHASDLEIDDSSDYPAMVTLRHVEGLAETGVTSTIRAKYVVGCDGARSAIRQAIGRQLVGDATNQFWGVMDVLAVTDFPDIRLACIVSSPGQGNMQLVPREGGYLVRLYVELEDVEDRERLANLRITPEKLTEIANRILQPYSIDVRDVGWWSVYEIGQRLCEQFDDAPTEQAPTRLPRVFLAGDACHTHSAKAGQGMNVSMADSWNLGWKLASVLRGVARAELLHTYTAERQAVAKELIDFDREFSALFSARPGGPGEGVEPEVVQQYFLAQSRFTAGVATTYAPSMIVGENSCQPLAPGFEIGMRLHSAPVLRLADARALHLGHLARADGAWRMFIFGDRSDPTRNESAVGKLCEFLMSEGSPVARFTETGAEPDSVIDVRAIFQQSHLELALEKMPPILLPRKGRFGLIDYEKLYCADPAADIFELREVDRDSGCILIVRPDQYVAQILPLDARGTLTDFFDGILNSRITAS